MSKDLDRPALFPVTAWTLVRRVQSGESAPEAAQALESLCGTYWEPVRRYLKALGCREEESADVTQDFFASFLRKEGFHRADQGLSKLRTYIKMASGRFLANHWRNQMTERRGGGVADERIDDLTELPMEERTLAEHDYDRAWAQAVLGRALERLESGYRARGRERLFEVLKGGLLRPGGLAGGAEVALKLGIPEPRLRLAVHRARQQLAEALRAEVAVTVESAAEVEEEVRYLIDVIAHQKMKQA